VATRVPGTATQVRIPSPVGTIELPTNQTIRDSFMNSTPSKSKLCLLINMISPARIPLYSALAERFDLLILHGGTESNRAGWQSADKSLANARIKRAWGWQISRFRKSAGKLFDNQYTHITPGYLWHLLRFGPHAVITNEMGLRTLIALAYGTVFRKPVWIWWGGTLHTERQAGLARRALRKLISRWGKRWLSYGWSSTEYLRSLGIDDERIVEIQNAVDESRFAAPVAPSLQIQQRPVLLHVGQLIARKGVEPLLQAAASLQQEGLEFSLVLVGNGPEKANLERLAAEFNLDNVHFEPARAPQEMPAVYRSADVLVFPTIEDVWGLVANEAILSCIPVLCSTFAGCAPELFTPESIFNPVKPEEFKAKLRMAITGQLPQPDRTRLRTTPQLADTLIRAIEGSIAWPAEILRDTPVHASDRS
jgi:glycosyltransferase involved in cell wall biosynthesis